MTIGREIKRRRKELGLTLEQAAGDFMSISRLSNIENNKTSLDPKTWTYLKDCLQMASDLLAIKQIEDELIYLLEKAKTLTRARLNHQAIDTYLQILEKSSEGYSLKPQADAYLALGQLYLQGRKNREAIDAYMKAADLFNELHDETNRGISLMKVGVAYFSQEKYDQAIKQFHDVLSSFDPLQQPSLIGYLYYNLASVFYKLKDVDKAASYCEKALSILGRDDPQYLIGIYNLQGILYANMNMTLTAKDKMLQAKVLAEEIQDPKLIAKCLHNIGNIECQLKNYDHATKYFSLSLEIKEANRFELGILRTQIAIASLHCQKDELEQALLALKQVLIEARKGKYRGEEIACLNLIRYIYKRTGQDSRYLDYTFKAMSLADGLHSTQLKIDILHDLADFHYLKGNIKDYYNTLHDIFLLRKNQHDGGEKDDSPAHSNTPTTI